jgi:hypothetical protein
MAADDADGLALEGRPTRQSNRKPDVPGRLKAERSPGPRGKRAPDTVEAGVDVVDGVEACARSAKTQCWQHFWRVIALEHEAACRREAAGQDND